jgi:hypothetical protein
VRGTLLPCGNSAQAVTGVLGQSYRHGYNVSGG